MINKINGLSFKGINYSKDVAQRYLNLEKADFVTDSVEISAKNKQDKEVCEIETKLNAINDSLQKKAKEELKQAKFLYKLSKENNFEDYTLDDKKIHFDTRNRFLTVTSDGSITNKILLSAPKDDITYILKGYEDRKNETVIMSSYSYNQNELNSYSKYTVLDDDGDYTAELYRFNDGKMTQGAINYNEYNSGEIKADKMITLKNGKIQNYIKQYYQDDNGDEKGIFYTRISDNKFKKHTVK